MPSPTLLAILDLEYTEARLLQPAPLARLWFEHGIRDVLVRSTSRNAQALLDVTLSVLRDAPPAARVFVSDRLDVALIAGAHGVQLASAGLAAATVATLIEKLGQNMLLARSVHSAADPLDEPRHAWVTAAPVYAPSSKPAGTPPLGLDGLATIVNRSVSPVLALGGITAERVSEVARAGASGVAVLGALATNDTARIDALVEATSCAWQREIPGR